MSYLKKYLAHNHELNINTWHLYRQCYFTEWTLNGNIYKSKVIMPNSVKKIMLELVIDSELDNYLKVIIQSESFKTGYYAVNEVIVEELFGDWSSFEKILNEKDETDYKYLREFKDFYAKFADTDYSKYVEYKFKDIPLSRNV